MSRTRVGALTGRRAGRHSMIQQRVGASRPGERPVWRRARLPIRRGRSLGREWPPLATVLNCPESLPPRCAGRSPPPARDPGEHRRDEQHAGTRDAWNREAEQHGRAHHRQQLRGAERHTVEQRREDGEAAPVHRPGRLEAGHRQRQHEVERRRREPEGRPGARHLRRQRGERGARREPDDLRGSSARPA